jgi:hypothetical protein
MINIQAQVDVDAAIRLLDSAEKATADWTTSWPALGAAWWTTRERNVFDTNGLGRWAPLKFSTLRQKKAEGSSQILVRTGMLLRQVTEPSPKVAGARFAVFGPGSPVPYAKYHLQGGRMPRRSPVPMLNAHDRKVIVETLNTSMMARIR